jgi:D-3-phosphoglycerate dehydrogenase
VQRKRWWLDMARILLPHPVEELKLLYGDTAFRLLSELGELQLNETGRRWCESELLEKAKDCDVIHSFGVTPGTASLFSELRGVRAFCRWAVDIRNIDVAAATRAGVLVTHGPAVFTAGVSELIIGLMLDLTRRITWGAEQYHHGQTPPPGLYPELRGAVLGIIGFGQIASYLARLAQAFGMKVLAYDPYTTVTAGGVEQVDLPSLYASSDHVVCLAKATEETEKMMNAAAFAAMKTSAYFINLSRGNLVDDEALLAALDAGEIAGAAVDVGRSYRQMPTAAVAAHPKVIATPHIGGLTPGSVEVQCRSSAAQVADILAGRMPERAVNPEAAGWLKKT